MQGVLSVPPRGFLRIIIVSLALHAVIIIGSFFYKGEERRFLSPVYNVSLVSPSELIGAQTPAPKAAIKRTEAKQTAVIQEKSAVQKGLVKDRQNTTPLKKTVPLKKGAALAKKHDPFVSRTKNRKEAHSVEDSISRITKKVKETDDSAELASHIETLKKKSKTEGAGGKTDAKGALKPAPGGRSTGLQNYQATGSAASQKAGSAGTENFTIKNAAYMSLIRDRVTENWIYPAQFIKDKISVIVSIKIGKNGRLLESWIEKSSGNQMFDDSLVDAIKKSAPFPPLPQGFEGDFLETGFRFCRGCN